MSKTLRWFHHKYEKILQSNLTDNQKSREYANLMTEMEHEFEIPILKNEDWEKKNKAVIALYIRRKKKAIIKEAKTDKIRRINLTNIYDEVQNYIKTVDSEWLFPSRKGTHAITTTQAYRQLRKAADMAEVESVGTHTMRKTFGYWYYKQTKDVAKLQIILNHGRPEDTLRYIGITEEEIDNDLSTFVL